MSKSFSSYVSKSYLVKGVDNDTGLDCTLSVDASISNDSGKIEYKLKSNESNAITYAMSSSDLDFELGGQTTETIRKTSHKETKNELVITNKKRKTRYVDAILINFPLYSDKKQSQIVFAKAGSQVHVQILSESIPLKTCTFEAR